MLTINNTIDGFLKDVEIKGFVQKYARGKRTNYGNEGVIDCNFPNRITDDKFVVQGKTQ